MGGFGKIWMNYPFLNTTEVNLYISTRTKNLMVDDGLGNISEYNTSKNVNPYGFTTGGMSGKQLNYSSQFTGDVKFYVKNGSPADIYSINLYILQNFEPYATRNKLYITDFNSWLLQFPNLYSINLNVYSYGADLRRPTIIGNLAKIPTYIKEMSIYNIDVVNANYYIYMNVSDFSSSSELEKFLHVGKNSPSTNNLNIYGDLKNLPPNIKVFDIKRHLSSAVLAYTAGRVWRSDFDTLYLNKALTDTENDNILIDLANSVTSAVGDKIIRLRGARTSASDAAVLYLEGLGFTVTIVA